MPDKIKKHKQELKRAKRYAFSKFIDQLQKSREQDCHCCDEIYTNVKELYKHISSNHDEEILQEAVLWVGRPLPKRCRYSLVDNAESGADDEDDASLDMPSSFTAADEYAWLPKTNDVECVEGKGRVLLFYKYRQIKNPAHVKAWLQELCNRLHLSGKVRIATEGINITVAGTMEATQVFQDSIQKHPLFYSMIDWDFKKSDGDHQVFPEGLKIGIHQEVCPMGIPPEKLSFKNTGVHLNVDQFHQSVQTYLTDEKEKENSIFIDCRNFYESKIGHFEGAVCPDIRKFSYWPEYVEKNKSILKDKKVYMYCTGGIRCERGSAYLLQKGLCDEVYQLHGGIHKYIEKYPQGFYNGKLFVFDDRYHISANENIVSACTYCSQQWDQYAPCSSCHCHQLVLSCPKCRQQGNTACCNLCKINCETDQLKEECECTRNRTRIPVEIKDH